MLFVSDISNFNATSESNAYGSNIPAVSETRTKLPPLFATGKLYDDPSNVA
jgi:hypothetical protein